MLKNAKLKKITSIHRAYWSHSTISLRKQSASGPSFTQASATGSPTVFAADVGSCLGAFRMCSPSSETHLTAEVGDLGQWRTPYIKILENPSWMWIMSYENNRNPWIFHVYVAEDHPRHRECTTPAAMERSMAVRFPSRTIPLQMIVILQGRWLANLLNSRYVTRLYRIDIYLQLPSWKKLRQIRKKPLKILFRKVNYRKFIGKSTSKLNIDPKVLGFLATNIMAGWLQISRSTS
jgi:hypothetical protein